MRRAPILYDALFGALAAIPVGLIFFLFAQRLHWLAVLILSLLIAPSSAASGALSGVLIRRARSSVKPIPAAYLLAIALAIAVAFLAFRLTAALTDLDWRGLDLGILIPAAFAGAYASHITQRKAPCR